MKIYLDTIGCRLNQSEIEAYARQFRAAGHTLVPGPDQADLVVINTCAVTSEAASDSRQKIRQAARAGIGKIVATGCWVTLNQQAAISLPHVSHVIPNTAKDHLVQDVLQIPKETFDLEPLEREPIPGARARTRAFIKAQDGCNNRCTFCITTLARGSARSLPLDNILDNIRAALAGGSQEIVITGVHLGSWGRDFTPQLNIADLVRTILNQTESPRLRLSSIEPWDMDLNFFALWENPRLCRHLHLPLQSGCAATLRRMARKTTPRSFASLVESARSIVPDLAITTDIITGFPGEDEAEFNESLEFIRQMQFAGGHVFTYSARPGTAAARMSNQIPHPIRRERNALVRGVLADSSTTYKRRFLDKDLSVLWESVTAVCPQGWLLNGLSDNYLRIKARHPNNLRNQISKVHLTMLTEGELEGDIVS